MRQSCAVSEIQSVICERGRWQLTAPVFGVVMVVTRSNFTKVLIGVRKLCVILRFAVLTKYRLVTDRRTDRHSHDHRIYSASIASRGKNKNDCIIMQTLQESELVLVTIIILQRIKAKHRGQVSDDTDGSA